MIDMLAGSSDAEVAALLEGLSDEQSTFVVHFRTAKKDITMVQRRPGSGKSVLSERWMISRLKNSEKILIACPSNDIADSIATRVSDDC
jgi:hypothetical protein